MKMMNACDLPLVAPSIKPELDPNFRPAILAYQSFLKSAVSPDAIMAVKVVLHRPDGSAYPFETSILAPTEKASAHNFFFLERFIKFLLWSRGAAKIFCTAPKALCDQLNLHYKEHLVGQWDADMMGKRIFEESFEIIHCSESELPEENSHAANLGRHMEGCRIGFDLGGSDRKIAAMIDGKTVFSEEIVWDPIPQTDPQWHYDLIMDTLKLAASKLPRVDAIGGSAAGVYVNNRVKVASLFRGVSEEQFNNRVKDLFLELKKDWNDIPFEVVNDGEVTALAGSMNLNQNAVLGIAMGTNQAAGFVTPNGQITPWLNELAFVPVDYHPKAPKDEWSGDIGCGVQYFSQQAVARLVPASGIKLPKDMPFPEQLVKVQKLMAENDLRAAAIYKTMGVYLGYALAQYSEFYDFEHLLMLGRVTTGPGADLMIQRAKEVLNKDFQAIADKIKFQLPDEKEKRHGQAMAAASLPAMNES
jgi:predicted NBD/HSP70 family sugar kinase